MLPYRLIVWLHLQRGNAVVALLAHHTTLVADKRLAALVALAVVIAVLVRGVIRPVAGAHGCTASALKASECSHATS